MQSRLLQRTGALKISLVTILSAFVVEFVFGMASNSLALLTDSAHALLDSVVTIVLLMAARYAVKPPDAEHTYGHGKIESLGGLIGGIAIFLIAIFFIYEAVIRIEGPPPAIAPGFLALGAAIYTICTDVFRIIILRKALNTVGGSTLKADFYHAFLDLCSTLVVIVGIVLVNIGFHDGDFLAALVLGVLLCYLSIKLIYKTAQDLTDIISPDLVVKVREVVLSTEGVLDAGPILMRRSGDTLFADVTISLRADVSFDRAHEISSKVEDNIKKSVPNSETTVHFEPDWQSVPRDSKIYEIASRVPGVKGVHNVNHHISDGTVFASLHVMVDREMSLDEAHRISEIIEDKIKQSLKEVEHTTIHLEPYIAIPEDLKGYKTSDEKITRLIRMYPEVKKIGRIVTLSFDTMSKIDINCSFDKSLSIEKVHDIISKIEQDIRGNFKNSVITIHPEPF